MKKNVLPSKLNLESPVPGAESASEEVHRRWQEVIRRRWFLKGIGMIGAALSAVSLLSTGVTAQTGSRNGKLSPADVALLLRFMGGARGERSIDAQYAELGGVGRSRLVYTISKRREPRRRRSILVGCRGEFVTNLGWLRRGDAHNPLENEVHSKTHSKLLPKFVNDLSPRHLDERETGVTVKDGERYEARHSLGDTYGVLND